MILANKLESGKGLRIKCSVSAVKPNSSGPDTITILVGTNQRIKVDVPKGMGLPLFGEKVELILVKAE